MKEVLINSNSLEIRVAVIEDGELVEFMVEREATRRLVGDVYLGRVNAILPGIQAAFIDIGYEKAGFLHASDLAASAEALAELEGGVDIEGGNGGNGGNGGGGGGGARSRRSRGPRREKLDVPPIDQMLRKGQEILVQVTKEAIGTKGPRLTTQISLPGRYVVYMPNMDYLGISRRIESRQERQRLRQLISRKKPANCAIIARTACEGVEDKLIVRDIAELHRQWLEMKKRSEKVEAPAQIHEEVGLVVGIMRDILADDIQRIIVDNEKEYRQLVRHLRATNPDLARRTKLHREKVALFDKYRVEQEIQKTLDRKVWLKKGGYLIIEQTEALVAIDVNTGRFVGKKNQEETILETNLLAAREIPRQLRLRDIGGIIVIDFIDMESEANKRKVINELRANLRKDRARSKAFAISDLGLVEVSRKRVRPSLLNFLSEDCPYCRGTGKVASFDTLASRVERWIRRVAATTREKRVQLRANTSLAIFMQEERAQVLAELEKQFGMKIEVQDDPRLHREDFRIVSLQSFRDLTQDLRRQASA